MVKRKNETYMFQPINETYTFQPIYDKDAAFLKCSDVKTVYRPRLIDVKLIELCYHPKLIYSDIIKLCSNNLLTSSNFGVKSFPPIESIICVEFEMVFKDFYKAKLCTSGIILGKSEFRIHFLCPIYYKLVKIWLKKRGFLVEEKNGNK